MQKNVLGDGLLLYIESKVGNIITLERTENVEGLKQKNLKNWIYYPYHLQS